MLGGPDVALTNTAGEPFPFRCATRVHVTPTDPKRDTRGVLRRWLKSIDASFIGLTGRQEEVNALMSTLRLPTPLETESTADGYTAVHSSDVLLFTQNNKAHLVYPGGVPPAEWKADLEKLLSRGFEEPKRK